MGGAVTSATSSDLYLGDTTGGDLQFNVASGDTLQWNNSATDMTWNFTDRLHYRKTINISLKKKPKVSESIRRLENPWLWTSGTVNTPNYYSQLADEAKSQQERNKFQPIIYKARRCGQSEIMRQMININLAQGKDVTVIRENGTPTHYIGTRRDLTLEGTNRLRAQVVETRPTVRITRTPKDHMDDIISEYNRRPTITIRLKRKVGYIKFKNGSTIYMATDSGEYKHVTGKSTKLLFTDYSPWTNDYNAGGTSINDMNGNDITNVGDIRFNNTGDIRWRNEKPTITKSVGLDGRNYYTANTVNFDDVEEAPIDIISSANRAYALESLRDESRTIMKGSNLAGSIPTSNLMIDTAGIGVFAGKKRRHTITIKLKEPVLTYEGLLKAQAILQEEDEDDYY